MFRGILPGPASALWSRPAGTLVLRTAESGRTISEPALILAPRSPRLISAGGWFERSRRPRPAASRLGWFSPSRFFGKPRTFPIGEASRSAAVVCLALVVSRARRFLVVREERISISGPFVRTSAERRMASLRSPFGRPKLMPSPSFRPPGQAEGKRFRSLLSVAAFGCFCRFLVVPLVRSSPAPSRPHPLKLPRARF